MKIIKYCSRYIFKEKIAFFMLIFFCILDAILISATPYIASKLFDTLITKPSMKIIYIFAIIYAIIAIFQLASQYVQIVSQTKIISNASVKLNRDMIAHMQKLPMSFFEDKDISYYNQRIYSDSSSVISFSVNTITQSIKSVVTTLLTLYIVATTNIYICLLFFVAIIIYAIQYKLIKKKLYIATNQLKEGQAEFYSKLFEQMNNIKLIKIFNVSNLFNLRLDKSFKTLYKSIVKSQRITFAFKGFQTILTSVVRIVILIIGGIQLLAGKISIGTLSVLLSYFSTVIGSATYFIEIGQLYVTNLVSFNRLKELQLIDEEINGNNTLEYINNIELKNISYGYKDKKLVKDLNIKFEKGKIYCIYGTNGVGKTTLINLLLGLHQIYDGIVMFNEKYNLKELDTYQFREKFCSYVTQDALLYKDTIYANITINNNCLDKLQIEEIAKDIGLLNSLETKLSLDSNISDNGRNLSGGEKQKISIIRSIIDNKDILIYDEPTSDLDVSSKKYFIDLMQKVKNSKNNIIIIITHDEELKNISDEIVSLEYHETINKKLCLDIGYMSNINQ